MAIRFFGAPSGATGYGNATTNFAKAFSMSKVPTKFILNQSDFSRKLFKTLNNYEGSAKTDFYLHCPPYDKHQTKATYRIGYFYWEADRLPRAWERNIKVLNELWVPCQLVKEACLRSNFAGKIRVVPTPADPWEDDQEITIPSFFSQEFILNPDIYKFYSIFQWQNRKGFDILLNSYYKSFNPDDKVILILKVNPLGLPGHGEAQIRSDILEIKRKLNLKYYPPVYLSTENVSGGMIRALHNFGDCYVSSHHAEGWGIPIHDAALMGKQIIITQFGGFTEWLNEDSAHIIKHTMGPVSGMEWSSLYGSYQNWAYPSSNHLSKLFRDVYENHQDYSEKGINARKIAEQMTIDNIADFISKELD